MVWVGLRDFFDPTQKFGFVRLATQPNPKIFTTQPNSLFSGWVWVVKKIIFKKKFYLSTIYNYSDTILNKR